MQKKTHTTIIFCRMIVKKFLIFLAFLIFSAASAFAADVSKLYTIKNANPDDIYKVLTPHIKQLYPEAVKKQNYYILENKQKGYYYVIILANKDENCYFYYMSNNEDESLRKDLLQTLKSNNFKNRKVIDSSLKSFFYGEAYTNLAHSNVRINMRNTAQTPIEQTLPQNDNIIRADAIDYDFSDEAQSRFNNGNVSNITIPEQTELIEKPIELNPPQNVVRLPQIGSPYQGSAFNPDYQNDYNAQTYQKPDNVLTGSVVYIQDGTVFTAALLSDISSDSLMNNDRISAELDTDWIYNGQLIAPEGSILNGYAIDTKAASFAMANGQIGLLFDEIMTPDGNVIPLKTNKVYIVGNTSRALNVTKRIAAGAATGLLLSAVSMLMGADPTAAIISGVSIGAGVSAISTFSTKGEEIRILEGSQLQIMLTEPLTVQLYRQ